MMKFDKLLKNKYLHYAAVALMVINVLGYVAMGSIECILVLGGAAYLAHHFTKNRTADIFIGLFVANILFGCGRLREGMKDTGAKAAEATTVAAGEAVKKAQHTAKCSEGQKMCPDGTCKEECEKKAAVEAMKAAEMTHRANELAKKAKAAM